MVAVPRRVYRALREVADIMTVTTNEEHVLFLTTDDRVDRLLAALKITNP